MPRVKLNTSPTPEIMNKTPIHIKREFTSFAEEYLAAKKEFTSITEDYQRCEELSESSLVSTFTWYHGFKQPCQTKLGKFDLESLVKLMAHYKRLVSPSVIQCYSRPNRATKLKLILENTLMFFHMTYSSIKFSFGSSDYLENMAELMVMYLDMELKASGTKREFEKKIASKITSSFIVYFGNKSKYILDVMLKSKMISKDTSLICDLIFQRLLRDVPESFIDVLAYMRYLLVFKRWKSIVVSQEEKEMITMLAIQKLNPPPGFKEKIAENKALQSVIPKIPKSCTDETSFLMKVKFFTKETIKNFFNACSTPKRLYDLPGVSHSSSSVAQEDLHDPVKRSIKRENFSILSSAGVKKMLGENPSSNKSNLLRERMKHEDILVLTKSKNEVIVVSSDEDDTPISSSMSSITSPSKTRLETKLEDSCMEIDGSSYNDHYFLSNMDEADSSLISSSHITDPDFLVDSTCYGDILDYDDQALNDDLLSEYNHSLVIDNSSKHLSHSIDFSEYLEKSFSMDMPHVQDERRPVKLPVVKEDRLPHIGNIPEKDKLINVVPPFNQEEKYPIKSPVDLKDGIFISPSGEDISSNDTYHRISNFQRPKKEDSISQGRRQNARKKTNLSSPGSHRSFSMLLYNEQSALSHMSALTVKFKFIKHKISEALAGLERKIEPIT